MEAEAGGQLLLLGPSEMQAEMLGLEDESRESPEVVRMRSPQHWDPVDWVPGMTHLDLGWQGRAYYEYLTSHLQGFRPCVGEAFAGTHVRLDVPFEIGRMVPWLP